MNMGGEKGEAFFVSVSSVIIQIPFIANYFGLKQQPALFVLCDNNY